MLQDVEAPKQVCMDRIRDLENYHKMVPHVRGVEIYNKETLANVIFRILCNIHEFTFNGREQLELGLSLTSECLR